MSPDRDQDFLCEGLAEELIDALTHVDGLRVAARTSSFQFRGDHDLREVGRKLGVAQPARRQRAQVRRPAAHHRAADRRRHRAITSGPRSSIATRATCSRCRRRSPKRSRHCCAAASLSTQERRAVQRQPTAHRDVRVFPARTPAHAHDAAAEHGRGARALSAGHRAGCGVRTRVGRAGDAARAAVRVVGRRRTAT